MKSASGYRVTSYHGDPIRYIVKYTPHTTQRLGSYIPQKHAPESINLRNANSVLAHLPYEGIPTDQMMDYFRLVKLSRMWQKLMQNKMYGPRLNMLSAQCERLYYRVYGHECFYGDVPKTLLPDKYWR
jgi:hypothetical protein